MIIALLTAGYKKLNDSLKERKEKEEAIKLGMQSLLRVRIIETYNHYSDKGVCPIYARENMEALYVQYHELGGNGTVRDLIEKLNDLPTE